MNEWTDRRKWRTCLSRRYCCKTRPRGPVSVHRRPCSRPNCNSSCDGGGCRARRSRSLARVRRTGRSCGACRNRHCCRRCPQPPASCDRSPRSSRAARCTVERRCRSRCAARRRAGRSDGPCAVVGPLLTPCARLHVYGSMFIPENQRGVSSVSLALACYRDGDHGTQGAQSSSPAVAFVTCRFQELNVP